MHIHPSGSKHWRQKHQFNGKEKLLSFGPYSPVTIAAATKNRNTFELVSEEYIEWLIDKGSAEATLKNRWLLQEIASPLASRPVNQITSAEVLDLLKRIEKSGRRETAKKLRGVISGVFRLAIMTLRAENDPIIAIRGALLPIKRKGRPAIVDEKEFGTLLNTIDEYTGWPTVTAVMKFQILTCVRPGEVRGALRSEVNLETAIWRIPSERMKMRKPHEVPLLRQALEVLDKL